MGQIPKTNEIYRHFKGNLYRILTIATHSETGERMVVYQALYGDYEVYVRNLDVFMSKVDRGKYPDVSQEERFKLIPSGMEQVGTLRSTEGLEPEAEACPVKLPTSRQAAVVEIETEEKEMQGKRTEEVPAKKPQGLDPLLIKFLDAGTYREKMNILNAMYDTITDSMINTMAVSLDLEVGEGKLEDRYESLKRCLMTFERYEGTRFR